MALRVGPRALRRRRGTDLSHPQFPGGGEEPSSPVPRRRTTAGAFPGRGDWGAQANAWAMPELGARVAAPCSVVHDAARRTLLDAHPLFSADARGLGPTRRAEPIPARDVTQAKATRMPAGVTPIAQEPYPILLQADPTWILLGGIRGGFDHGWLGRWRWRQGSSQVRFTGREIGGAGRQRSGGSSPFRRGGRSATGLLATPFTPRSRSRGSRIGRRGLCRWAPSWNE